MYGWRARIGLIVPSTNTVNECEFHRALPDGISVHTARMHIERGTLEDIERMDEHINRCADLLATADVDVMVYGCTAGGYREGAGYDERIEERITDLTGIPAVAASAAVTQALEAFGVESVAVTSPYIDEINDRARQMLEAKGYDIVSIEGLGTIIPTEFGRQLPEMTYRKAREIDHPDADCVFVSGTDYRTFEIISVLETDLGKPVVTSNQATLWRTLTTVGLEGIAPRMDLGTLFERFTPRLGTASA